MQYHNVQRNSTIKASCDEAIIRTDLNVFDLTFTLAQITIGSQVDIWHFQNISKVMCAKLILKVDCHRISEIDHFCLNSKLFEINQNSYTFNQSVLDDQFYASFCWKSCWNLLVINVISDKKIRNILKNDLYKVDFRA